MPADIAYRYSTERRAGGPLFDVDAYPVTRPGVEAAQDNRNVTGTDAYLVAAAALARGMHSGSDDWVMKINVPDSGSGSGYQTIDPLQALYEMTGVAAQVDEITRFDSSKDPYTRVDFEVPTDLGFDLRERHVSQTITVHHLGFGYPASRGYIGQAQEQRPEAILVHMLPQGAASS
jgi:hypothetical protein